MEAINTKENNQMTTFKINVGCTIGKANAYQVVMTTISGEIAGIKDSFTESMGEYKTLKGAEKRKANLEVKFGAKEGAK